METAKAYPTDFPKRPIKKKFNEFTPINSNAPVNEIIKEFLFQKDVAAWFRGTSHYHIKGANKLFNALRDDGEQETTHRVRTCLNLIGLNPMITSKEIKFLMELSRGNDLVFLWFLMEKHYKTPKRELNSFSQNEQLICSAICHLDMVTTLRELDKILPRGQQTSIAMKKKCPTRQDFAQSNPKRKNKMAGYQFALPYFMKHNQPRRYGKNLLLERPNFIVNFKYYSDFNNPNYIVQNESNRWYGNYQFNPGKRVVHSIIRDIIKSIFYIYGTVSSRATFDEILCGYHKTLKLMEGNLKHKQIAKAREKCLKHCLPGKEKKEAQSNNVKKCLEDTVQKQMCIFNHQANSKTRNYTLKTITSDCKVFDIVLGGNGDCNKTAHCESCEKKVYPSVEKCTRYGQQKRKGSTDNFQNGKSTVKKCTTDLGPRKERFYENNSCAANGTALSTSAFFKSPFMQQPYIFDYQRIFTHFNHCEESGIRKIILETLNEKTSNVSTESNGSQILYDDAVKKFVSRTFEKEVNSYKTVQIDETATQCGASTNPLKKYYSSANFDPANCQLMDQMLFEAFQYLRKNPKFVWAQLPDAHKVPFLREWISHRYGKEYTPTERAQSYRQSFVVFRALEKSNMKFCVPTASKIGNNFFVDYNCRKHVEKKLEQIKSKYYRKLDSHFLEHTRSFWFAMRGYICSNGPPRKSFYAYMPSRLQDIQHCSLWKSSEYRNNWDAWNNRRREEKRSD